MSDCLPAFVPAASPDFLRLVPGLPAAAADSPVFSDRAERSPDRHDSVDLDSQ